MKRHIPTILLVLLCLGFLWVYIKDSSQVHAQNRTISLKFTVLSPVGQPPPIQLKPMAPRLKTLNSKTIYLVNDGYLGTDILLGEMETWFKNNMPEVKTVYRQKGGGGFTAEDPQLWAEIKEKADAVVMGMGH